MKTVVRLFFVALISFVLPGSILCQDQPGVMTNAVAPLAIPTPDGSGQATEPSIVNFETAWHGYQYWLVVGPYSHANQYEENPSILVSNDGMNWSVPPGVANPLEKPVEGGHLEDSTLFYDQASDQLWIYYEEEPDDQPWFDDEAVERATTTLMRITSGDGIHWSAPQPLINAPDYQLVMPAVTKLGNTYWLWTVNAGVKGCSATFTSMQYRTSSDGTHWSGPGTVSIIQPGYKIWHTSVKALPLALLNDFDRQQLDRQEILRAELLRFLRDRSELPREERATPLRPSQDSFFVMLASAYTEACGRDSLFLAYSTDGIDWNTFSNPLLTPNPSGWDTTGIYESTFDVDLAGQFSVWYAADGLGGLWHIGLTQGDFSTVIQDLMGSTN